MNQEILISRLDVTCRSFCLAPNTVIELYFYGDLDPTTRALTVERLLCEVRTFGRTSRQVLLKISRLDKIIRTLNLRNGVRNLQPVKYYLASNESYEIEIHFLFFKFYVNCCM